MPKGKTDAADDGRTVTGRRAIGLPRFWNRMRWLSGGDFDAEPPNCHAHTLKIALHPAQKSKLQQWLILSQGQRGAGTIRESRRILQVEFEKTRTSMEANLAGH
jgi:hypothetical protein